MSWRDGTAANSAGHDAASDAHLGSRRGPARPSTRMPAKMSLAKMSLVKIAGRDDHRPIWAPVVTVAHGPR
jgi:hypothetical protein